VNLKKIRISNYPLFIALVVVLIVIYTIVTLSKQKSDALVGNIAGRQRMLNQRHLKEVMLTLAGVKTACFTRSSYC